jgi:hypothetical protein
MARNSSASAVRFSDAESSLAARESYRLETEVREAVAGKLREPFLPPIVDFATTEPIGFEALARWPRQDGVMMPSTFVPIATERGITEDLDLRIFEKTPAAMALLARSVDVGPRSCLLALMDNNPCPPPWRRQPLSRRPCGPPRMPCHQRWISRPCAQKARIQGRRCHRSALLFSRIETAVRARAS